MRGTDGVEAIAERAFEVFEVHANGDSSSVVTAAPRGGGSRQDDRSGLEFEGGAAGPWRHASAPFTLQWAALMTERRTPGALVNDQGVTTTA